MGLFQSYEKKLHNEENAKNSETMSEALLGRAIREENSVPAPLPLAMAHVALDLPLLPELPLESTLPITKQELSSDLLIQNLPRRPETDTNSEQLRDDILFGFAHVVLQKAEAKGDGQFAKDGGYEFNTRTPAKQARESQEEALESVGPKVWSTFVERRWHLYPPGKLAIRVLRYVEHEHTTPKQTRKSRSVPNK